MRFYLLILLCLPIKVFAMSYDFDKPIIYGRDNPELITFVDRMQTFEAQYRYASDSDLIKAGHVPETIRRLADERKIAELQLSDETHTIFKHICATDLSNQEIADLLNGLTAHMNLTRKAFYRKFVDALPPREQAQINAELPGLAAHFSKGGPDYDVMAAQLPEGAMAATIRWNCAQMLPPGNSTGDQQHGLNRN